MSLVIFCARDNDIISAQVCAQTQLHFPFTLKFGCAQTPVHTLPFTLFAILLRRQFKVEYYHISSLLTFWTEKPDLNVTWPNPGLYVFILKILGQHRHQTPKGEKPAKYDFKPNAKT